MSRIYLVTDSNPISPGSDEHEVFLVEALTQTQAIGLVVQNRYSAKPATACEVADFMESGLKVIRSKRGTNADQQEEASENSEDSNTEHGD